ncbi:MAG: hypothetical protein ABI905_07855 [Betaproteobacteria bacterium]
MTTQDSPGAITRNTRAPAQPHLKIALLLAWRSKGFSRPRYGLVNDEELQRTGRSIFLTPDGHQLRTTLTDLLLLQSPIDTDSAAAS